MSRYKQPYTLHKRGKYWYYQTYHNGIRTTARTTGQTNKTLAREYCERLLKSNRLYSANMTLSEYAEGFFDRDGGRFFQTRISPITDGTVKGWESKLNARILPVLGHYDLSEISLNTVANFRAGLFREGVAYATVRQIMQSLKAVLNHAARSNLMDPIAWDMLEPIKTDKKKRDGFTHEEAMGIFSKAPEDLRPILTVLMLTGTRISEAYGIRETDVMQDGDLLYIHLDKQLKLNSYEPLKTKDERDLPIIPELVQHLHPLGYSPAYIYESINPIIRTCPDWQDRKLSIHSFRHFFITSCKVAGINPQLVETYAGHSLRGIQEVYTSFHVEDYRPILDWQKGLYEELEEIRKRCPTGAHTTMRTRQKKRSSGDKA